MKKIAILFFGLFLTNLVSGSSIVLTWTDNASNETSYKVERSSNGGTSWTEIQSNLPANTVTYTDNAVTDGTNYSYRVRCSNAAGNSTYSNVAAAKANSAPTISNITNKAININTNTGPIAFTVADSSEAASSLTVTGTSSNLLLVPNVNVVFGGSGANRTVTITPLTNQVGVTTITLTVSDGSKSSTTTFTVTVTDVPPAAPSALSAEV